MIPAFSARHVSPATEALVGAAMMDDARGIRARNRANAHVFVTPAVPAGTAGWTPGPGSVAEDVVHALRRRSPLIHAQIVAATGRHAGSVTVALSRLHRAGIVTLARVPGSVQGRPEPRTAYSLTKGGGDA